MEREFELTENDFRFLVDIVGKKAGIVLNEGKKDMVYSRLSKRLRILDLPDFKAYCNLIENDESEIVNLVNSITTNLTKFFREYHHFECLEFLLQQLKQERKTRIRIWSAGCSSGQEPYSIALTLAKIFPDFARLDIKILATDIDTNIVAEAKKGMYKIEQLTDIPTEFHHHLEITKDHIIIDEEIKKMITFNQLNLIEEWPMRGEFDIIFCRNVVIYFDKSTQKILFDRYANLLKKDGNLFIGHSENISTITTRFELKGKTIYKKTS